MDDDHDESRTSPDGAGGEEARLRAEVARLRAQLAERPAPPAPVSGRWRPAVVVVCLVLLAVAAPAAIVASWADDQVGDTDRYVETVGPLADDPAVQAAVSDRLTTELVDRLDVRGVAQSALDAVAERDVPPAVATSLRALGAPLARGVETFVREQVERLVRSDAFADAWRQANREAHGQLVAVLTGDTDAAVTASGNAVRLNLAVLLEAVKERLADAGFTLVERVPTVSAEFTLVQDADIGRLQTGFRVLSGLAVALPVLVVGLLVAAVAVSRRPRHTLVVAGAVVAGSMLGLGLALNVGRVAYLDAVPSDQLPADAATIVYDQLVRFVRQNLRAVLVLALVIAAVAWATGGGPAPTAVRRATSRAVATVRHGSDRAGLRTGRVGVALHRLRAPLRAAVAATVVLVYVLTDHPTGASTIALLVVAAVVLLVLELLARDEGPPGAPS